ncbi:MAG: alpha/beta fold hydrolase [Actinomycetota bacterium]
MIVPSTDGVEIAVHDLGGVGPRLLISHATGFHGHCYEPLAHALADRVHSIAFDYRGHGDTPRPDGAVDWQRYGDDAEAMAAWLVATNGGTPVDAFGHSMGGACLLIAAHRQPSLFRRLVLFEPIVFPPQGIRPDTGDNPMVAGARRRRATFPSYQAAIDNFAAKPPLNGFTPEALRAYVLHGFTPDDDGVHLKCRPDTEAATFEMGPQHDTYDRLPEIGTEVLVVSGRVEEFQPSNIARQVADRLPNGRYLQLDQLDHFGPMARPLLVADVILEALQPS